MCIRDRNAGTSSSTFLTDSVNFSVLILPSAVRAEKFAILSTYGMLATSTPCFTASTRASVEAGRAVGVADEQCRNHGNGTPHYRRRTGTDGECQWIEWNTRQDAIAGLRLVGCFSLKG